LRVADARLPRRRDQRKVLRRQVGERLDVLGSVDDDLLPLEGGVEVRDYANPPPGRVGLALAVSEGKDLGRRLALVPFAERAAGIRARRAGSLRPPRRDDDEASRERIAP
jgi:hypothetical protein